MATPTARDYDALVQFSRCVVDRSPRMARAAIDHDFRDPDYKVVMNKLVQGQRDCLLFGTLRMRGVVLAGAIAEALIKKDLGRINLAETIDNHPNAQVIQARDEGEMIALCIARKAPGDVATLLATPMASDAERLAMAPLVAQLGPCTASGVQARFNKAGLRAIVALAYRRVALHHAGNRAEGNAG